MCRNTRSNTRPVSEMSHMRYDLESQDSLTIPLRARLMRPRRARCELCQSHTHRLQYTTSDSPVRFVALAHLSISPEEMVGSRRISLSMIAQMINTAVVRSYACCPLECAAQVSCVAQVSWTNAGVELRSSIFAYWFNIFYNLG